MAYVGEHSLPRDDLPLRVGQGAVEAGDVLALQAPFSPTPPEVLQLLPSLLSTLLPSTCGEPRVLEAGCGDGRVADRIAEGLGAYVVCLELSPRLLLEAKRRHTGFLVEHVEADMRSLPLRPGAVHITYTYTLPGGVEALLDQRIGGHLVALDYYSTRHPPPRILAVINGHTLYHYSPNRGRPGGPAGCGERTPRSPSHRHHGGGAVVTGAERREALGSARGALAREAYLARSAGWLSGERCGGACGVFPAGGRA